MFHLKCLILKYLVTHERDVYLVSEKYFLLVSTHFCLLAASLSQKSEYFLLTVAYAGAITAYI